MIGLKRGTVYLEMHKDDWNIEAEKTIAILYDILGLSVIDIQHIGSTSIRTIYAKPIIDIVIGVKELEDMLPYLEILNENDIIYRGSDQNYQLLFVKGDFKNDTRTHHIHVTKWNTQQWNNYINFRDYLNFNIDKAKEYDELKLLLQKEYPDNRNMYTSKKQQLIDEILNEAFIWRNS